MLEQRIEELIFENKTVSFKVVDNVILCNIFDRDSGMYGYGRSKTKAVDALEDALHKMRNAQ